MRIQPRQMSLTACISRCPTTTRCPEFSNSLASTNSSRMFMLDTTASRVVSSDSLRRSEELGPPGVETISGGDGPVNGQVDLPQFTQHRHRGRPRGRPSGHRCGLCRAASRSASRCSGGGVGGTVESVPITGSLPDPLSPKHARLTVLAGDGWRCAALFSSDRQVEAVGGDQPHPPGKPRQPAPPDGGQPGGNEKNAGGGGGGGTEHPRRQPTALPHKRG